MFTIGIFSTHIPYIAFVAIYLGYLLFPAQLKFKENISETNDDNIVVLADVDHSDNIQDALTFDFCATFDDQDDLIITSFKEEPLLLPIERGKLPVKFYPVLFSRPPPVS